MACIHSTSENKTHAIGPHFLTFELLVPVVAHGLQGSSLHLPDHTNLVSRLHQASRVHLQPEGWYGGYQEIVVDVMKYVEDLPPNT